MNSFLKKKTLKKIDDLKKYLSKCKISEVTLYDKMSDVFLYSGVLFDNFIKEPKSDDEFIKNAVVSVSNAFKHLEDNDDFTLLSIKRYGTDFSCFTFDAPFGDIAFFGNCELMRKLDDKRNYNYYRYLDGKRLDHIIDKIERIVGEYDG